MVREISSVLTFHCTPPQLKNYYLLTPWCRILLEKLTGLQLVKKFPAFHATRRIITALTNVHQLSISWAGPIQSIYPHPTSWRSILILSTHLRLGLPTGLLPSGFPTKTPYTPFSSPIRATYPAHLILLDFITRTILGEEYKSFIFLQNVWFRLFDILALCGRSWKFDVRFSLTRNRTLKLCVVSRRIRLCANELQRDLTTGT